MTDNRISPNEYAQIQELFLELRELDQTGRESRLAEIGADSAVAEQQVRALLEADSVHDSVFDEPLAKLDSGCLSTSSHGRDNSAASEPLDKGRNPTPEVIGPYRILQKIGEGGHGLIYMAEQKSPIRRKVAIKLIKPGMESKLIIARFEAERQALAMMKHPSIANVIDAGTSESGSPYFVMELVHGAPIDEFCRDNKLSLPETLTLFQQVCEAVHHAHRKGVIHRDLKPANILVTVDAGKPLAKVIDFGIAKALHLSLTDRTLFTEYGQIVGTLEYMSPEQAMMSQDGADVRSDVYALGVILYVLLTGDTPISRQELLEKGPFEIPSMLQEVKPPTPSVRITQSNNPRTWRDSTQSGEQGWSSRVRGELDWVTMKALAKEIDQRYDSAAALSADIDHFLNGQPVAARPPSYVYLISKWILRHRTVATLIGVLAASALVCFAAVSWGWYQSQRNLAEVLAAEQLVSEKAEALSQSLEATEAQRRRADGAARRMALLVKRDLLEEAWSAALDGDEHSAAELLDHIAEQDRDYAWRFVDAVLRQIEPSLLRPSSSGAVRQIALHASTNTLAVVTTDSQLELWSIRERKLQRVIPLEKALYSSVTFSSRGDQVLLGASNRVRIVRLSGDTESREAKHNRGGTRRAAFDEMQDAWWVTTGSNFLLKLDAESMAVAATVRLPTRVSAVSASTTGPLIAVATLSGSALIIHADDPSSQTTISGADSEIVDFYWAENSELVALSASGRLYAASLESLEDDAARNALSFQLRIDPGKAAESIARAQIVSPSSLIAVANDGQVGVWGEGSQFVSLGRFSNAATQVCGAGLDGPIVIQHYDGRMNLISSDTVRQRRYSASRLAELTDAAGRSQGHSIVTGHIGGKIRMWTTRGAQWTAQEAEIGTAEILSLDIDESSQRIAAFSDDWRIRLTDLETLELKQTFKAGWGVRQVVYSHNGSLLAGPPKVEKPEKLIEGTIDIWDPTTGRVLSRLFGHTNWVIQLAFSQDDTQLFSLGLDATIRVWDVDSGQLLQTIDLAADSPVTTFALLESSDQLVTGRRDGSICVRSLRDGAEICSRHLSPGAISGLFAPAGANAVLITAENCEHLTLISLEELAVVAEFDARLGSLQGSRVDRQGRQLILLGEHGAAFHWRLPTVAKK